MAAEADRALLETMRVAVESALLEAQEEWAAERLVGALAALGTSRGRREELKAIRRLARRLPAEAAQELLRLARAQELLEALSSPPSAKNGASTSLATTNRR